MSIALKMNSDLIERSLEIMRTGLLCVSIYDDDKFSGNRGYPATGACSTSPSTSSSIGNDSDVSDGKLLSSDGDDDFGDAEVQSSYNGSFVSMESLEEVLPIRRGISSFYSGKSKSFASLADASSLSSTKHIAKTENAYTRKRRNLLAFHHGWEKNKNLSLRSNGGRISKRPSNLSRSTLALAVAMSSSESITTRDDSGSSSPLPLLPPFHPQTKGCFRITPPSSPRSFTPWRSFSLADLQHCATTNCNPGVHNKEDPLN